MVIVASVTMNGLTPAYAVTAPFPHPTAVPTAIPTAAARAVAPTTPIVCRTGALVSAAAAMTPASASTDPTDRSIPAVTMTNVMPSARMALIETCRRIVERFSREKNPGTAMAPISTSSPSARATPYRLAQFLMPPLLENRLGARALTRKLPRHAPFAHHDDPVGERQDLGELG